MLPCPPYALYPARPRAVCPDPSTPRDLRRLLKCDVYGDVHGRSNTHHATPPPIAAVGRRHWAAAGNDAVRIRPVAGQLLLWPAWLPHSVATHRGKGRRVSISFNVWLGDIGDKDDYDDNDDGIGSRGHEGGDLPPLLSDSFPVMAATKAKEQAWLDRWRGHPPTQAAAAKAAKAEKAGKAAERSFLHWPTVMSTFRSPVSPDVRSDTHDAVEPRARAGERLQRTCESVSACRQGGRLGGSARGGGNRVSHSSSSSSSSVGDGDGGGEEGGVVRKLSLEGLLRSSPNLRLLEATLLRAADSFLRMGGESPGFTMTGTGNRSIGYLPSVESLPLKDIPTASSLSLTIQALHVTELVVEHGNGNGDSANDDDNNAAGWKVPLLPQSPAHGKGLPAPPALLAGAFVVLVDTTQCRDDNGGTTCRISAEDDFHNTRRTNGTMPWVSLEIDDPRPTMALGRTLHDAGQRFRWSPVGDAGTAVMPGAAAVGGNVHGVMYPAFLHDHSLLVLRRRWWRRGVEAGSDEAGNGVKGVGVQENDQGGETQQSSSRSQSQRRRRSKSKKRRRRRRRAPVRTGVAAPRSALVFLFAVHDHVG